MRSEFIGKGRAKIENLVSKVFRRDGLISEDTSYAADYLQRFHDLFQKADALSPNLLGGEDIHYSLKGYLFEGFFMTLKSNPFMVLNVRDPKITDPLERILQIKISYEARVTTSASSVSYQSGVAYEMINGQEEPLKNAQACTHIDDLIEILEREINPSIPNLNPSETGIPTLESEDLNNLDLQLEGSPTFDHLSVFICDPLNPQQYWFRKIKIERSSVKTRDTEYPYIDITTYDLDEFNQLPCPEDALPNAVKYIVEAENGIPQSGYEELQATRAAVGVARYNGENKLTLNELIRLAAVKYHRLKAAYLN